MVYGNKDDGYSGSGVLCTRNPCSGQKEITGELTEWYGINQLIQYIYIYNISLIYRWISCIFRRGWCLARKQLVGLHSMRWFGCVYHNSSQVSISKQTRSCYFFPWRWDEIRLQVLGSIWCFGLSRQQAWNAFSRYAGMYTILLASISCSNCFIVCYVCLGYWIHCSKWYGVYPGMQFCKALCQSSSEGLCRHGSWKPSNRKRSVAENWARKDWLLWEKLCIEPSRR